MVPLLWHIMQCNTAATGGVVCPLLLHGWMEAIDSNGVLSVSRIVCLCFAFFETGWWVGCMK